MANFTPKKRPKKSRQELNDEARLQKHKRKHKGLPSGTRQNSDASNKNNQGNHTIKDARLGSKKPVSLIANEQVVVKPKTVKAKQDKLTPAEELMKLENDPRLETLLDKIERDDALTDDEQRYVDKKLDRIEALIAQLGLDYEDGEDNLSEPKEDIVRLLKNHD